MRFFRASLLFPPHRNSRCAVKKPPPRKNFWLKCGTPPANVTRARRGLAGEGRPVSGILPRRSAPIHTNAEKPSPYRPNPALLRQRDSCLDSLGRLISIPEICFPTSWRRAQRWGAHQLWRGSPSCVHECAPSFGCAIPPSSERYRAPPVPYRAASLPLPAR